MQRKDEVIQNFILFGRNRTLGPHPTLSPAPALAQSRNRERRPSADNPLRLSDRIPEVWSTQAIQDICTGVGGWGKLRAQKRAEN